MKTLSERLSDRSPVSQGTYATCFRAHDKNFNRTVFLKLLNPVVAKDREMRQRFEREAQAVSRLSHPYLIRLYEFGEDPIEGMYMLHEWVDGMPLHERLRHGRLTSPLEICTIAEQLLTALDVLHSVGVIHRDIKPENILLCTDGSCKITDFSLAALTDSPKLTHHQAVVGTPAYMSPEQAAGKPLDVRTDLFSVGVVLYEAATGRNPFLAEDVIETLRRIRSVNPPLTDEATDVLPRELRELILKCLAKKPSERPENARAALALLSVRQGANSAGTRTRRSFVVAIAAVLFLSIVAVIFMRLQKGRRVERYSSGDVREFAANPEQPLSDSIRENPARESALTKDESAIAITATTTTEKTALIRDTTMSALPPSLTNVQPESVDVFLDVKPWAQISADHVRLGTTPMRKPVRLPAGRQTLTFYNPAYPTLQLTIDLNRAQDTLKVNMSQMVSTLEFEVLPWGTVFIDDESFGATPFNRAQFVMPGQHHLRIAHPSLSSLERDFSCRAGDSLVIRADMDRKQLSLVEHVAASEVLE